MDEVRQEFPVLHQKVNGRDLVYFDNAATTQKPAVVVKALTDYYEGYNANIHRGIHTLAERATRAYEDTRLAAQAFIKDNPDKTVELLPIGRKGRDFFRNRRATLVGEFLGVTGKGRVEFSEALEVARHIIKLYTDDTGIDKVFLIYNEFKSVLSQRVVLEQLLPVARAQEEEPEAKSQQPVTLVDYIYEQPPEDMLGRLLPRLVETQIFRALLESVASEHGARMTAMDSASKNASELIDTLTLNMNRIRQAAITNEIIEVVSGAAAL